MAMMQPVSGLSEFVAALAQIHHGERSPYPFYCALLYTVAEGVDADLARFVDENWAELDAMTGDHCLVFVIGDTRDEPAVGDRPFSAKEVYRVADELGVRAGALPCAAFFADPGGSREVLRLRLREYLPEGHLMAPFRGIASALQRCDGDLDCLRRELVAERERLDGDPSAREQLESAAATTAAVEKVVVGGSTIATTVLTVLGLVL